MKKTRQKNSDTRMIHVRIPEEVHKRLRISAAENDVTMQDWVAVAIKNELDNRERQKNRKADDELNQENYRKTP